jgi:hypothetical protein
MATTSSLHRLIGKMALEDSFRYKMLDNPMDTARSVGVFLTREQAGVIKQLDPETINTLSTKLRNALPPVTMDW